MRRVLTVVFAVAAFAAFIPIGVAQEPPRLDGEWIVLDFGNSEEFTGDIHIMRADGTELTNLSNNEAEETSGELAPDGTAIAFVSYKEGDGLSLMLMDVDGDNRRPLVQGFASSPTWTPDGQAVVYGSGEDLRIVDRFGTNDRLITTVADGNIRNPSVSPDGTVVVFDTSVDGQRRLYRAPMEGGEATLLTEDSGFEAEWDPDGSRILFVAFRDGYGDNLWSMDPDGQGQANLIGSTNNDFHPTYSPDGTRVMFESVQAEAVTISVHDLVSGATTDLLSTGFDGPRYRRPNWTDVALDPFQEPPPTTVPTTVVTTTGPAATGDATTTTTEGASVGPGSSNNGMVTALLIAIALLVFAATGIVIWDRRRIADVVPPPPPGA